MLDRKQILKQAYHDCMKEMYAKAQPPADYDQLLKLAEAGEDAEIYKRHFLSVEEFRYILNKYIKAYKIKESWIPNMELLEEYLREGECDAYRQATAEVCVAEHHVGGCGGGAATAA